MYWNSENTYYWSNVARAATIYNEHYNYIYNHRSTSSSNGLKGDVIMLHLILYIYYTMCEYFYYNL